MVTKILCHPALSPTLIVINGNVNPLGNGKRLWVAASLFQGINQDVPLGLELFNNGERNPMTSVESPYFWSKTSWTWPRLLTPTI